jgi:tetratricopeptide (TPR) repeat protein
MPAARRQLWLIVGLFIILGAAISVAYVKLRASNIQVAQGRQAYDAGKYELAEDAYRRAVEMDSRNAEAWYWLGISCKNQGRMEPAADALVKATELSPDNLNWWFECAQALQWASRFDGAQKAWGKFIEMAPADDPRTFHARLNQAHCILHGGDAERAIQMLQDMLAHQDNREARFELAKLLSYAGRYDESVQEFQKALGEKPQTRPEE